MWSMVWQERLLIPTISTPSTGHSLFVEGDSRNDGYDVFTAFQKAIAERYRLQNNRLLVIEAKQYGLNLNNDELVHLAINTVVLYHKTAASHDVENRAISWHGGELRNGYRKLVSHESAPAV